MATGIGERGFVALDDAHNNGLPITLEVVQPQMVTRSTSGRHRGPSVVPPGQRRLGTQRARQARTGRKWLERRLKHAAATSQALQNQRVTTSGFRKLDTAPSVWLLESNVLATDAHRPKLVCNES